MAPRKKRGRNDDMEEYIADCHLQTKKPATATQHLHTHYEPDQRAIQSFITVTITSAPPALTSPSTFGTSKLPPFMAVENHIEDEFEGGNIEDEREGSNEDEREGSNELEGCDVEALGLGHILSQLADLQGQTQKRRRTQADHPLLCWIPYIDTYVSELLRLEGRGDVAGQSTCAGAGCEASVESTHRSFRCRDCQDLCLYCLDCICIYHASKPFHRIQAWNGIHFERVSLKTLGLHIQLGHADGSNCPHPDNAFNNDFTIIDSDGIHEVSLDYCSCPQSPPKPVQLLRARLFPSTVIDPRTAATFRVLETFQMLTFTSKVSGYEYYRSLVRRTDNTGTSPPPDRYHSFLRIVREWRHVRLMKRMGRGHDAAGVRGTKEGQCAVLCPACPIPGVNLPANWKDHPTSQQWLYSLFLGIDANFRLKRLNVSNDERDPGLNHGYAYIVENTKFNQYLHNYGNLIPDDKSTCNNHDAIKSASMRGGKGTAASGLGTIECSRHDMKRPNSVGDLQKGERYVNMDYFFLSSLKSNIPERLVVSYDIACQWSRNLPSRCGLYPPNPISSGEIDVTYLVPKFHLPAHVAKCQIDYSFNLVPGVGRTDGEAPERGWAAANGVAMSTKEMGPGSRRDTLDDHFGDYNWRKITHIAETFSRKSLEAIKAREEHVEAFLEFDAALPMALTTAWTKLCWTWEADRSQENPFSKSQRVMSEADVRLQLAEEDARELARGSQISLHDDVSASMLIFQGLELQELQRRHALDVAKLGEHSTSLQQVKVVERSTSLKRKIDAWIEVQHLYMPAIALLRAHADCEGGGRPPAVENIELFLPSAIVGVCVCEPHLLKYEWQFRYAQAEGSLDDLRGLLLMRSMINTLLNRLEARIRRTSMKYRKIQEALVALSVPLLETSWTKVLQVLNDSDITGLTSMDDSGSEGRKRLTWIWNVQGIGADADESTQATLHIEWCKARARAHRWQEECLLLAEEMRRVVAFFSWQAEDWRRTARKVENQLPTSSETIEAVAATEIHAKNIVREGKIAYAHLQGNLHDKIKCHCENAWADLCSKLQYMEGMDATIMAEHQHTRLGD
ncbi:hypothetical protein BYT27DRAFT_7219865 [Phlegmacium glaucopus]|nr:hypothetical protein BYT27DRAFT_7219865 [Phlegmacium glaucopus]